MILHTSQKDFTIEKWADFSGKRLSLPCVNTHILRSIIHHDRNISIQYLLGWAEHTDVVFVTLSALWYWAWPSPHKCASLGPVYCMFPACSMILPPAPALLSPVISSCYWLSFPVGESPLLQFFCLFLCMLDLCLQRRTCNDYFKIPNCCH